MEKTKALTPWIGRDMRLHLRLEFKPADCWIGVYWEDKVYQPGVGVLHIWLCLLPMLPIHMTWV